MPTAYPTEFKIKTIRRYEKGASIKALSQELHIAQSTLYQWRNTYCSIQTPDRIYTPAEFDAISRRLQKLEHEMQIIRVENAYARRYNHIKEILVQYFSVLH